MPCFWIYYKKKTTVVSITEKPVIKQQHICTYFQNLTLWCLFNLPQKYTYQLTAYYKKNTKVIIPMLIRRCSLFSQKRLTHEYVVCHHYSLGKRVKWGKKFGRYTGLHSSPGRTQGRKRKRTWNEVRSCCNDVWKINEENNKILHYGGENLAPSLQNKTEIFGIR